MDKHAIKQTAESRIMGFPLQSSRASIGAMRIRMSVPVDCLRQEGGTASTGVGALSPLLAPWSASYGSGKGKVKLWLAMAGVALAACVHEESVAASREEVMRSRYLKYQFCMERAFGQGFYKRVGLVPVLNRWGVSEPSSRSLTKAPAAVQHADSSCRAENELSAEPRPQ